MRRRKKALNTPLPRDWPKIIECPLCGKAFSNADNLWGDNCFECFAWHLRNDHYLGFPKNLTICNTDTHPCPHCGQGFDSWQEWESHLKAVSYRKVMAELEVFKHSYLLGVDPCSQNS